MTRSAWDTVWAEVAQAVSRRSACDRAQVGAVLVQDNRVVSTGYNGPASGYSANTDYGCSHWCLRAASAPDLQASYGFQCPSIHAEANALLYRKWGTKGMTLYITHSPCADCAKLISNSGVSRVVLLSQPPEHRPNPIPYLQECGLDVVILPTP